LSKTGLRDGAASRAAMTRASRSSSAEQARRVRRRHVDGEIARDRREQADEARIIGGAIVRILVGSDIDADDAGIGGARHQTPQHDVAAVIVEAHAVEHGFVARQTKQARTRIAGLRTRGHRTDFDETEAEAKQRIRHFGVLVEARRHADRVRKAEAKGLDRKRKVIRPRHRRRQQLQPANGETVCVFGIEQAKQRQRERVEGADQKCLF
jgi:hypothetical protein